ncbi:MAG: hypothetical protein JW841_02130 [Deltaproteobacteria bacterium]|nr:hypothetical protein [Deltaproteobacteria bacterium]
MEDEQSVKFANQISENGWQQGSILPLSLTSQIDLSKDIIAIVISHDCDLLTANFIDEPFVEIALARVSKKNGSLLWGKNPRKLQLKICGSQQEYYEIKAWEKRQVKRELLATNKPDQQINIDDQNLKVLQRWLGKRYFRAAFPDEFNNRWKNGKNKISKILRNDAENISAIYLLGSNAELPKDKNYIIELRATMAVDDFDDFKKRNQAQNVVQQIETELNSCDGIEIAETILLSEADISLDDLKILKRWDFDSMSIRDSESAIAEEPI